MTGIQSQRIAETPIAIVDFETTGLTPGADRVVEVSIVRVEPGQRSELVLDTLVDPCRAMAATEIHGITDDDVQGAPRFSEIAEDVAQALSGAVVAAYNVYSSSEGLGPGSKTQSSELCAVTHRWPRSPLLVSLLAVAIHYRHDTARPSVDGHSENASTLDAAGINR